MKIIVTGSSGFIGYHLCNKLLSSGHSVVGIDCENDSYDVSLKNHRRNLLLGFRHKFMWLDSDIENIDPLVFEDSFHGVDIIIHLAARAGVQASAVNPRRFLISNIDGFFNIASLATNLNVPLIYASSSSVYGYGGTGQLSESCNTPISFYAATKKCNEIIAESMAHSAGLVSLGIRFFTVYGPYGRPDMSIYKFTKAILQKETIKLYNMGKNRRNFTYIDDAIDLIIRNIGRHPDGESLTNCFGPESVSTFDLIKMLEKILNKKAKIKLIEDVLPGDVESLNNPSGAPGRVNMEIGLSNFCEWFREYHQI